MKKKLLWLSASLAGVAVLAAYVFTAASVSRFRDRTTEVKMLSVQNANIYLVKQSEKWLMIDSGLRGSGERLVDLMKDEGVAVEDIQYLLLTHGHNDHAGSARYFQKLGIPVVAGLDDAALYEAGANGAVCPTSWFASLLLKMVDSPYEGFIPDLMVDSEFDLSELGFEGRIFPQSSHTAGTLVVKMGSFLFVGDQIRGEIFRRGRPATHFFMCDLDANQRELEMLAELPGVHQWMTGHSGPLPVLAVNGFLSPPPS